MIINSGKGMCFYQPGAGGGGGTVSILVDISAKLTELHMAVEEIKELGATTAKISTEGAAKIGLFTVAFEKLADGIIEASRKAGEAFIHFVESSMEKAAEIQTESFPLTMMLREHAEVAKEVLEGIHSAWQEIGVVSNEALGKAARNLILIGVPAENLIRMLTDLSKIATASGVEISNMTAGYQRFRQAIETNTAPMIRGMGAFGAATLAIMQALIQHFNKTEGELRAMFKAGQISIQDLNVAINEATTGAGKFADAFVQKRATFDGAVMAMKTAWQGFQVEIGKPIIDFLVPIINRITVFEQRLAEIARNDGWKVALKAAWEVVLDEMVDMMWQILLPAFGKIGEKIADALAMSFMKWFFGHMPALAPKMADMFFTPEVAEELRKKGPKFIDEFFDAIASYESPETVRAKAKLKATLEGILPTGDWARDMGNRIWFEFLANKPESILPPLETEETHRADVARQLAAELHRLEAAMNAVRQEQTLISQAPFLGADETQVARIHALGHEFTRLKEEMGDLEKLKGMPLDEAQIEVVNTKLEGTRNRLLALRQELLATTHPFQAELQRWANSFGSTAQQIARTIEGTINVALQSFNQYLVTGKFNAQELLRSIILLGLQLVEQLIIQRVVSAINTGLAAAQARILGPAIATAMGPAATAMTIATQGEAAAQAPFAIAAAIAASQAAFAVAHKGGWITSLMRRFHAGGLAPDEVPIIAQTGEIMMPRRVTQQPGMSDFLMGLIGTYHNGGEVMTGAGWAIPEYNSRGEIRGVWTERGWLPGATPSWYTSPSGQGPVGGYYGGTEFEPAWLPGNIPGAGYISGGGGGFPASSGLMYGYDINPGSIPIPGFRAAGAGPIVITPTAAREDILNYPLVRVTGAPPSVRRGGAGGGRAGLGIATMPRVVVTGAPFMTREALEASWGAAGYYSTSIGAFGVGGGGGSYFHQLAGVRGGPLGGLVYGGMTLGSLSGWVGMHTAMPTPWGSMTLARAMRTHPAGFYGHGWGTVPTGYGLRPVAQVGGRLMSSQHSGGMIGRMHPGGAISRSVAASLGGVHIYAFTDLKSLTKHMASREGQKIIFDTVRGRRIDLGMK